MVKLTILQSPCWEWQNIFWLSNYRFYQLLYETIMIIIINNKTLNQELLSIRLLDWLMINNIKHLLRTIKHLFIILLIFLLIYDTKVSLCYIHEAIVSLFHVLSRGQYPIFIFILSAVLSFRLRLKITKG